MKAKRRQVMKRKPKAAAKKWYRPVLEPALCSSLVLVSTSKNTTNRSVPVANPCRMTDATSMLEFGSDSDATPIPVAIPAKQTSSNLIKPLK